MTITQPFPLQWPQVRARRPANARRNGKFNRKERRSGESWTRTVDISVADALKRLQEELDAIGARYPVVSSNLETRLDGLPRSGQRKPDDPGVAVYFQLGGEPHCLPCDTYLLVEHNIAAIAAHIEATRAIERHGVASVREMFSGFAALPAPQKWFEILGVSAGSNADVIRAAYRALAANRHPDRPGGSHDAMSELNKARDDGMRAIGAHS